MKEIQDMAHAARDSLTGSVIDVYYEYSFNAYPNGSSEETEKQVMLLNDQEAVEDFSIRIYYNSDYESVEFLGGQTILPGGHAFKIGKEATRSEGFLETIDLPLYANHKVFIVTPPALIEGAIVEVFYRIRKKTYPMHGEFWRDLLLQRNHPLWRWKISLRFPITTKVQIKLLDSKELIVRQNKKGSQFFECSGGPLPMPKIEMMMPPDVFKRPRLVFSTLPNYEALRRWYWDLIAIRMDSDPEMIRMVAALTYQTQDKIQQIMNLSTFVRDSIRYVGLEFLETAYLPTPAQEVLLTRYGDCKDKAALLIAMLNIIGVDASIVLISSVDEGEEITDLPVFDQFSHALVYIPKHRLWIDPTNPYLKNGELNPSYKGRLGLIISDSIFSWQKTPPDESQSNVTYSNRKIDIDPSGAAEINSVAELSGAMATLVRTFMSMVPSNMRESVLKMGLAKVYPEAEDISILYYPLDDADINLRCSSYVHIDKFVQKQGKMLIFTMSSELPKSFTSTMLENRTHPIYLPMKSKSIIDIDIHYPSNYFCSDKIEEVHLDLPFSTLSVIPRYSKGRIQLHFEYTITENYIRNEYFPALKELMEKTNNFQNMTIILNSQ